jgi:hypothetical protein
MLIPAADKAHLHQLSALMPAVFIKLLISSVSCWKETELNSGEILVIINLAETFLRVGGSVLKVWSVA